MFITYYHTNIKIILNFNTTNINIYQYVYHIYIYIYKLQYSLKEIASIGISKKKKTIIRLFIIKINPFHLL